MGHVGAAVVNPPQSALLVDRQAVAVTRVRVLVFRQYVRRHHLVEDLGAADVRLDVVLYPRLQVLDAGVHTTGADGTPEVADLQIPVGARRVPLGAVGHDVLRAGSHHGPAHVERPEDVLLHEDVEVLA